MKNCITILFPILFNYGIIFCQTAEPPSGSGTSNEPYQISSLENLYWITAPDAEVPSPDQETRWSAYYIQTTDIDASTTSGWDSDSGWIPIGSTLKPFWGQYDGDNHKITNLTLNRLAPDTMGIFRYAGSGSVIKNLGIEGGTFATSKYSAVLIGFSNDATIDNCWVAADMSGTQYSGGLIGYMTGGTVSNCWATGNTSSGSQKGGLIGTVFNATVSYCRASVNLNQGSVLGGLVGYCSGSTIEYSYADGNITGTTSGLGYAGLVAFVLNNSTIRSCYSTGTIGGAGGNSAGLISLLTSSTVINCYAAGSVNNPSKQVAGLIYQASGTVSHCYSIASLISGYTGSNPLAGLIKTNSATVTNCFWDTTACGTNYSAAGTGKSTSEMKTNSTFTDAGWDIAIWNIGDGVNNGYPYLDWQNSGGTPLPVELTLFIASVKKNNIILNWQTATEVKNYGFSVERRVMSDEWKEITFVKGSGNSNSVKNYSFIDNLALAHDLILDHLQYRLKQIDLDGKYEYSDVVGVNVESPAQFTLEQNYPNPFNPTTTIKFSIPGEETTRRVVCTLKIYNILGREVATLVNEQKAPGNYEVTFNGSKLASGMYFYKLSVGNFNDVKKFVLVK